MSVSNPVCALYLVAAMLRTCEDRHKWKPMSFLSCSDNHGTGLRAVELSRSSRTGACHWPVLSMFYSATGRNLVLQKGDATLARVAVYQVIPSRRRKKQALVAYCDLDLASHFDGPASGDELPDAQGMKQPPTEEWHNLQVQRRPD